MSSTSLQLNQLLGELGQANAARKNALNFEGLIDGNVATATPAAAFEGFLASLLKGSKTTTDASVLLGSTPTSMTAAANTNTSGTSLEDLLKGLPPELAALLRAQAALEATGALGTSGQGQSILDALSTSTVGNGKTPELFAIIDDPKLAAALSGLNAQLTALQANVAPTNPIQGALQQNALSPALAQAAAEIKSVLAGLQNSTITIASLNGDEFQALKKIAFADLAPFLTQPRTVVIDGRVAKIAQGPAFLNDGTTTDVTVLALNAAALAPVLTLQQVTPTKDGDIDIASLLANNVATTPGDTLIAAMAAPTLTAPALASKSTATQTASDGFVATGAASADAALTAPTTGAVLPQTNGTAKIVADAIMAAATANNHVAAGTGSHSRGFGDILSDLKHKVQDAFSVSADGDISGIIKTQLDQSLPNNASSTLMNAKTAGHPHPSTHLVSIALQRNMNPRGEPGTERSFSITMDPGSLGRVKVTLEFGENNTVKAKLLAERPETLSLLQKDVGTLDRVLSDNGFDTSAADSFSFDLGNSDSFSQAMHDNGSQSGGNSNKSGGDGTFGTEAALLETVIPVFVDPATGLTHVNITV